MWIPESFDQIARAAVAGDLEESSTFDAKAPLPVPKKNVSLAVDVAAMTVDGGVLVYGIAEDDGGRFSKPYPESEFRVTSRIEASELDDGESLIEGLLGRFFEATTGWDAWTPFR
jgi:hypothetical protein